MPHRYRVGDWRALKKGMPKEILDNCGFQAGRLGFCLISFGTDEAQEWVESRLGPSLEAPYGVDIYGRKTYRSGNWIQETVWRHGGDARIRN